jgi:hypothetical protein
MWNVNSSPELTNCTFSYNEAATSGGGVYNLESSPTVTNCTFYHNTAASQGGGMLNVNSPTTLTNCILWEDSPDELHHTNDPPVVTYSDIQGGYPGEGNIDQNPLFDQLGLSLTRNSPCIDAATLQDAPLEDIEGESRPFGEGIDMGADEYHGTCSGIQGDLDCDGDVDGNDLAEFAEVFGAPL